MPSSTEHLARPPHLRRLFGIVDRLWYVADAGLDGWELKLPGTSAQVIIGDGSGAEVLDLFEYELAQLLRDRPEPDRRCREAVRLLRSGRSVAVVADRLGTSQGTLTRQFRRSVGMPAKQYQRLLRLERAIRLAAPLRSPDWAEIAVRTGCYDQAHLTHEFTELAGLTPARWHRIGSADPYHLPIDDDFFQDVLVRGCHAGDHERLPQRQSVPALPRR